MKLLFLFIGLLFVQTEKKMKVEFTQDQVKVLYQALGECNCPQYTVAGLRTYLATEYDKTWPDTTKKKDSTRH